MGGTRSAQGEATCLWGIALRAGFGRGKVEPGAATLGNAPSSVEEGLGGQTGGWPLRLATGHKAAYPKNILAGIMRRALKAVAGG